MFYSKYIRNKPLNARHLRLGSPWSLVAGRAHDNLFRHHSPQSEGKYYIFNHFGITSLTFGNSCELSLVVILAKARHIVRFTLASLCSHRRRLDARWRALRVNLEGMMRDVVPHCATVPLGVLKPRGQFFACGSP